MVSPQKSRKKSLYFSGTVTATPTGQQVAEHHPAGPEQSEVAKISRNGSIFPPAFVDDRIGALTYELAACSHSCSCALPVGEDSGNQNHDKDF